MLAALAWTPAEAAEPLSQHSAWVWLPLADTFHKRDLDALEMLSGAGGAVVPPRLGAGARARAPSWAAALAAAGFALALELGQLAVPGRTASTTGVVVAALGAALGCKLGRRLGLRLLSGGCEPPERAGKDFGGGVFQLGALGGFAPPAQKTKTSASGAV